MTTYNVRAKRWRHGWELHIDDVGVTQSKTLATADQMVRDYIETLTGRDVSGATVVIMPELGEQLGKRVAAVRAQEAAAARASKDAQNALVALAEDLRRAGLSATDCGIVLGKSRGRISQIAKAS